jgi:serine/threonine-protein kinase
LAWVSGLKVIARTSAFAFRGKEEDVRKIAAALGVSTVLQGSVRRSGSHIRVTAQLINAADGSHLWSERFDREMADVFALQDEIAQAMARALKVTLTARPGGVRPHEPNLAAYDAFLKGRHHYAGFSPEEFTRAEECFIQAAALDPRWAEPRSALSDLYFELGFYGWRPIEDMIARARAEAQAALELLPSDPMAHAVMCIISGLHDYDWRRAEDEFQLVRSSGSLPPVGRMLCAAHYSSALGRYDQATAEMAMAIAEDPLNPMWRARQAWMLLSSERYDDAIVEARKALELDDRDYQAHMMMALAYTFAGNVAEARQYAEETVRLAPFDSLGTGLLAGLVANAGDTERAEHLIETMTGAIPIGTMMYHLICGNVDAALDWYQKDLEQRRPNAPMMAHAGFLKPLRASPRWASVARMMNLAG